MAPNSEDYDAATYPRSGQHRPRMASRKKNLQHAGLSLCTTPLLLELRIGRGRRHGRQRPRSTAGCSSIFRQICRVNHRGRHPGFYPKAAHTETVPKSRASLLYPGSTDFDGGASCTVLELRTLLLTAKAHDDRCYRLDGGAVHPTILPKQMFSDHHRSRL
jgi:hypothetical protein